MYGLKYYIELDILIDSYIIQICFGVYQIQFNFNNNIQILAENEVNLYVENEKYVWESGETATSCNFLRLLDKPVIRYEILYDSDLVLYFSDNERIEFKDNVNFESYSININSQTYIV